MEAEPRTRLADLLKSEGLQRWEIAAEALVLIHEKDLDGDSMVEVLQVRHPVAEIQAAQEELREAGLIASCDRCRFTEAGMEMVKRAMEENYD